MPSLPRTCTLARLLAVALVASGCEAHFSVEGADVADAGAEIQGQFHGKGVGVGCSGDDECRSGLVCAAGLCKPGGIAAANDACLLSDECAPGLQCGFFGFCVPSGGTPAGGPCTSVSDCLRGYYCDLKGISGFCVAAAKAPKDLGQACKATGECFAGLLCSKEQGTCQPGSLPLSTDLFAGVACPVREEEDLPFQARNVVPRAGDDPLKVDFYGTPFPNDVWLKGGKLDLSRHPRPGPGLIGLDLVGAIIESLSAEMTGFSVAPTIYVRFTRPVDMASLVPSGPKQNVFLIDLHNGELLEFTSSFHAARNKYICANWLALHPNWSRPLAGKRTYGVVITDDIRADLGGDADPKARIPVQGDDLGALLGSAKPADATLGAAWEQYAKLRAWVASKKLSSNKVIAATSFTTEDPTRVMKLFRASVLADPEVPKIAGAVFACGGANKGKKSPCVDPAFAVANPGKPDPRDCPANADALPFTELHFKLRLPVWQAGKRPYLEGGGGVQVVGAKVKQQGHEEVCASLTLPKGKAMPKNGWPLVFYAHGTGGSLRSGPSDVGETIATLQDGGSKLAVALLSIDQPMHGDRRGAPLDPGPLFYNFANPPAAKGNVYQGAADNFALVRFASTFNGALPVVGATKFDATNLSFIGHSQGGTTGPVYFPWAHAGTKLDQRGAVFSGTGGSLVFSLLNKKSPEDATVGIKLALSEGDLDAWHPVLSLMQHYFDEVDPLIYGSLYYTAPVGPPLHVLHTFGQGDTYTPPETSRVFAASTGGLLLKPTDAGPWFDPISDLGMKVQDHKGPISGNIKAKGAAVTGVTVQHLNDASQSLDGKPYDGHFVAFKDKVARQQMTTFLSSLIAGKTPVVPHQ